MTEKLREEIIELLAEVQRPTRLMGEGEVFLEECIKRVENFLDWERTEFERNSNWKEEFYQKFTDGADKDNDYYDSQFQGQSSPEQVEFFINNLLLRKN